MIRQKIESLIKKAVKEGFGLELGEIEIEKPKLEEFGDYATNVALVLAKKLKKKPQEIAKVIAEATENCSAEASGEQFSVRVAGPGFINFFLSRKYLFEVLNKIIKEKENYGRSKIGKGKTVVIDYSAPNIAKPFGIGHLRSTIIGQAIYNIYKFLGWRCIGDNHLGDWGTQFGKIIYQLNKDKLAGEPERGKNKILKNLSIEELEKLYVKFHEEAEKNPAMEEGAREWFKKLEQGNKEAENIWQACIDISLREYDRIYRVLGIKIDYTFGESFYRGMMKKIIDEALKKKVASKAERGALIIKYPEDRVPPAMILKSDGATTYFTRELATVKYRFKKWQPNLIIYEVGADQTLHFKQLFWAAELLGWAKRDKFFHVAHGLIRFKEGKFSTRKGLTIHLEDILKEAIQRAGELIDESETNRGLGEKQKQKVAAMVGLGAVKYNDLSQHWQRDIIFDWKKILNLKGNTAPYLQYTYARCQSVLHKARFQPTNKSWLVRGTNQLHKEEEDILRAICWFPEAVEEAAMAFSPNLICNFVFELAQKYNLFYAVYPIIKAEKPELKTFRLMLSFAVAQIIKNSLMLLGISAPERM